METEASPRQSRIDPLVEGHVYEYDEMLLEATRHKDTWWLRVLDDAGRYVHEADGVVFGYEWDEEAQAWVALHYALIPAGWPDWSGKRGAAVEIDLVALELVADSRNVVLDAWRAEGEKLRRLLGVIFVETVENGAET